MICEHNITVKEIIKHKTHKKDYYTDAIGELKKHKNNIKDWSPAECLATYIYIVSMYTDKTSYEYNFEKLPAQQSGAFKDFYDEVIEKIPADQQKGPNKDPLYRIFNRVTKLHNSNDFNDYDAYNEIINDVKNADGKSSKELKAERKQRIEKENQKLKEMFDTISEKIEKMGEFNRKEINKIIKESMNEYKQYGSRGFTIARSYLNRFIDNGASYNEKVEKYESKEEHTELEEKVFDYLNEFIDLYNQKYHKEYLKNELKTSIEESFGNIKELSRKNVSSQNVSSAENATRELMMTIYKLKKETETDDQLTEEQKHSFNEELEYLHGFSRGVILNFVFELQRYFEEEIDISSVVILESEEFNFNLKFNGGTSGITEIDSSNILYLEEAFRPLFECLNAMYQDACSGKTFIVDDPDGKCKLKLGKWNLDDWLKNGSSSDTILYPASLRPKWIEGTESHAIKFYKTENYYIYDIGEKLGGYYTYKELDSTEKLEDIDKYGYEHPFFKAVEKVFGVSEKIEGMFNNHEVWDMKAYCRSKLKDTPFFRLKCEWHKKLSKKLQMEEINFNPIPIEDKFFELFPESVLINNGEKFKYVGYIEYKKTTKKQQK